jgi:hypothetical protein
MRSPRVAPAIEAVSSRGSARALLVSQAILICQLWSSAAAALEPRSLTEPDVLREPAAVTRVVDAFEDQGGIDLHFTLDYQHSWKRATISRETQDVAVNPGAGAGIAQGKVAHFSENTSRLDLQAELGLFHDLALIVRLPIILSSNVSLERRAASPAALDGAPGQALFSLPFHSPNRSGVEFLGLGIDWGIFNQWRDAAQPTLLVGVEGRFAVSEPMHACGPAPDSDGVGASARRCAYPSDINRDGIGGQAVNELSPGRLVSLEGDFPAGGRRAGVSRGTTSLALRSVVSRRFQNLEPYMGFGLLLEFANRASDFAASSSFGQRPPTRAAFSLGTELMPWEVVEQFQRLSIDARLTATYHSAGQDYSELFDALGSSGAASYRRPNFAGYMANPDPASQGAAPSVVDPASERVFPTGLTGVQAHGSYALRIATRWQAGQYVHFDLGAALALTQAHLLSSGQPCALERGVDVARAGPCLTGGPEAWRVIGAPDPTFRPEINSPGRRFSVDTATTLDAWVGATVMF